MEGSRPLAWPEPERQNNHFARPVGDEGVAVGGAGQRGQEQEEEEEATRHRSRRRNYSNRKQRIRAAKSRGRTGKRKA